MTDTATPATAREKLLVEAVLETDTQNTTVENTKVNLEDDEILRTEAWIEHDRHQFYTVTYAPKNESAKATVTFIHGLGEHIDRYDQIMRVLAQAGIQSHGYDQRGYGKTGLRNGILGHTEGFKKVLDDVEAANKRARIKGVPHFLYGHSMGGMIVLNYGALRAEKDPIDGIISTGPAIQTGKRVRPGTFLRTTASLLAKIMPTFHMDPGFDHNNLTRDSEVVTAYKASEYNISHSTLRTLKDVLENGDALLNKRYATFKTPLLLVHGTHDEITCPDSSQEFFNKLPEDLDKTLLLLEENRHEVHNELEKEDFFKTIVEWIDKHTATPSVN
ncbi:Alpha/Beta hydrolase protein [Syncephalis fuscata]|nr:Alpha/Beta hydrolase protein [Syncephalis fuscata]